MSSVPASVATHAECASAEDHGQGEGLWTTECTPAAVDKVIATLKNLRSDPGLDEATFVAKAMEVMGIAVTGMQGPHTVAPHPQQAHAKPHLTAQQLHETKALGSIRMPANTVFEQNPKDQHNAARAAVEAQARKDAVALGVTDDVDHKGNRTTSGSMATATALHQPCECGNVFSDDTLFCCKCGTRRCAQGGEETKYEDAVAHGRGGVHGAVGVMEQHATELGANHSSVGGLPEQAGQEAHKMALKGGAKHGAAAKAAAFAAHAAAVAPRSSMAEAVATAKAQAIKAGANPDEAAYISN